jgi:hypothetical protein
MNHALLTVWNWLHTDLRRLAILVSIIFSIWVILTHDTINTDGVLYLDVAYHLGNFDWQAAAAIYHWNFYPALIALVSKLSFLSLENSAFLINTLFLAGLAWLFLSVLMQMGANHSVLMAGLVLVSIHPYINDYRADIIRGPGFWFFVLYGTYLLIRLQETGRYRYGVFTALAFIMAALFRIEGVAFLLFAPLVLLIGNQALAIRIKTTMSTYLVPVVITLIAALLWMFSGDPQSISWTGNSIGKIYHPLKLVLDAYHSLIHEIPLKGEIISTQVLNQHSEDYGVAGVISILATILVLTIVKRITLLILILAVYAKYQTRIKYLPILLWLSLINIGYMAVYVTHEFFLSSRFAMPIAILVALMGSFGLAHLFRKTLPVTKRMKLFRGLAMFFIIFLLLDGLISTGTSKTYLREGGYWIKQHIQPDDKLVSNQFLVNHYADVRMTFDERAAIKRFDAQLTSGKLDTELLENADYVVIRTKHVNPQTLEQIRTILGGYTFNEFSASDRERLLVYSRP